MKNYFKIILLLVIVFTISKISAQQSQDPQIQAAKTEILGEWVSLDDNSSKIIFYGNGDLKRYYNGSLMRTHHYDIKRVCEEGELTIDYKLMLITLDENGNKIGCDIIQGLNENNSGVLSLTTGNQGKNIVYERP